MSLSRDVGILTMYVGSRPRNYVEWALRSLAVALHLIAESDVAEREKSNMSNVGQDGTRDGRDGT